MKINFSSNTEFSKPMISPEFQNSYGNRDNSYRSWGEKLATPSSFDPMDFFKTGMNTINSLNISSGTKLTKRSSLWPLPTPRVSLRTMNITVTTSLSEILR